MQSGQPDPELLMARIAVLERELAEAHRLAVTDELTGLLNRRGWEQLLVREEGRCRRHGLDAVVVVADLDHLKEVNDIGGHQAGDELLRRCARTLCEAVRGHDCVARPGGDEFAVLAVQTRNRSVEAVAARLDELLAAAGVQATLGAAALTETAGLQEVWHEADQRMLARKSGARARARGDRGAGT